MVDILLVLEGATYMAFIVGAIVAVYELRDLKKTRELEVTLRITDQWLNRDFVETSMKIANARFATAKDVQDQSLEVDAKYIADFFDSYAGMIRDRQIDRKSANLSYDLVYKKLEPWILHYEKENNPGRYDNLRWAVGECPKWTLEDEKKKSG